MSVLDNEAKVADTEWHAEAALRAVGTFASRDYQQHLELIIQVSKTSPRAGLLALVTGLLAADVMKAGVSKADIDARVEEVKAKAMAKVKP